MPSATILSEKQKYVADLAEQLKNAVAGVIVDYRGINVADDTVLRKELREAGVKYTVVKNTMLRLAAREAGLDVEGVLEGTTALATSDSDYVAAAKILCKYADAHENFNIKLGFMDGEVLDAAKVPRTGQPAFQGRTAHPVGLRAVCSHAGPGCLPQRDCQEAGRRNRGSDCVIFAAFLPNFKKIRIYGGTHHG